MVTYEDAPLGIDASRGIIGESSYRAYMNQSIATFAGLPYAPATVRMPFRHYFCERGREVDDSFASTQIMNEAYMELAKDMGQLRLPVVLAVALQQASAPSDMWDILRDLRHKARGFRAKREELDRVLQDGHSSDRAREALVAARSESLRLSELLESSLQFAVQIFGRKSAGTLHDLVAFIPTAFGLEQAVLPPSVRSRLFWRVFRPELRFMTDIRTLSREMTNAMPTVGRLWELSRLREDAFIRRFDAIGSLYVALA